MLKISDFIPGTACVYLCRSWFKEESKFEDILQFLELPENLDMIMIHVNNRFYDKREMKVYPANYG